MHTHHDLDAVILTATMLSSKRRPAQLVDVVAAADLIQGFVPFPEKLGAAIERLSALGLIAAAEGGLTLTPAAHDLLAKQPAKTSPEDLAAAVADSLAALRPRAGQPALVPDPQELGAAVRTYKATRKSAGGNLLMPKPKVVRHFKVEGRWRRAVKTR